MAKEGGRILGEGFWVAEEGGRAVAVWVAGEGGRAVAVWGAGEDVATYSGSAAPALPAQAGAAVRCVGEGRALWWCGQGRGVHPITPAGADRWRPGTGALPCPLGAG